jgi:signal transduction histidine kinase
MPDVLLRIADPVVGVVLGVCGLVLMLRRRQSLVGPLMLLGCACWFLGSLWGVALFLHRGPLVHLHISYPTGRIRRPLAIVTVVCAYLASVVEAVAVNPWVTLGMAGLVALAAVDIYARTSGPARKAGGPALGAALTFASVLALSAANQLLLWQADRIVLVLYDLAICAVAFVLAADLLWGRWTEANVADFVTQLGSQGDAGSLTTAVQRALGDPTATIGFWLADQRRYVDDRGAPVDAPVGHGGREVIAIDDQGEPAALLVHDATGSHDAQLIADVVNALRLALGNARLQARVRARVVELGRSRRRLVEAADAQRAELQADIANGPQRHLCEVAALLSNAEQAAEPSRCGSLRAASDEILATAAELRELAEGIRPAALRTGGLADALPLLIGRAHPLRTELEVARDRLPAAVEGAVYFVCAEALANVTKHARASQISVTIAVEQSVVARIVDDGRGGADPHGSGLRGLRDRVEALDGRFTVADRNGRGTIVTAEIPLEEPR